VTLKLTDVSEERTASINRAMMMEAVHSSETSANFNVTLHGAISQKNLNFKKGRKYIE
jgi:hypothetical protein